MKFKISQHQLNLILENEDVDIPSKTMEVSYKFDPKVEKLQKKLVEKNYYIGKFGPNKDGVDGKYGPFTKAAHEAVIQGMDPNEFENKRLEIAQKYIGDIDDENLKQEFRFNKIPDGKNNYRSAQIPVMVGDRQFLGEIIDKYGIKSIIRFNGDGGDSRHRSSHPHTSISDEEQLAKEKGIQFYKLSSTRHHDKVKSILNQGNTLIHCAHGADRTGGNVGGYLKSIGFGDTNDIWNYTTQFNSWNSMVRNTPTKFVDGGYLRQAQHFGVKDLEHAQQLAGLK